ncbi:hypothetical protein F183_A54530 (plasmid) [Bryobacterales bacterium F-183]|nr:hypothetical protein F183_A54530 [Bryobacterales bacterium F-183]
MSWMNTVPVRWAVYFVLSSLVVCAQTTIEAIRLGWTDDRYNHTLALPVICLILLYQERDLVSETYAKYQPGLILAALGVVTNLVLTYAVSGVELYWRMLAVCVSWVGGYLYCYGPGGFRATLFPCLLLLACPPIPESWIHRAEVALQWTSADVSEVLLRFTGASVYREGLYFAMPGLNVEVARECSGIRSTTALIIVVAVAAHLLLRSTWARILFFLLAVPAGIFKNGVRISTLAWLGSYMSPEYLHGWLHKNGGPPFTMVALAFLVPSLLLLQRLERKRNSTLVPR